MTGAVDLCIRHSNFRRVRFCSDAAPMRNLQFALISLSGIANLDSPLHPTQSFYALSVGAVEFLAM